MALTGQLDDLSLAELIEFFCNQRKTGRLNVAYKRGAGVFYLEEGEIVDARIGNLTGVEAVYFALTLPNASFDFQTDERTTQRTIERSWAQVILEGLRRFDEKQFSREDEVFAGAPFVESVSKSSSGAKKKTDDKESFESDEIFASLSQTQSQASGKSRAVFVGGIVAVALVGVGTIGAFIGFGGKGKSANPAAKTSVVNAQPDASNSSASSNANDNSVSSPVTVETAPTKSAPNESAETAARREREQRQRQLADQQRLDQQRLLDQQRTAAMTKPANAPANNPVPVAQPAPPKGGQTVVVRVSVDAEGRVTQASVANSHPGNEAYEAAALRAARSKHFAAGQAGMQSVPIKIN